MKYYRDYYWEEGRPYGRDPVGETLDPPGTIYRIISDPYYKWISIEQYRGGMFLTVIYDSKLFDFRNLKPIHQIAWQKEPFGDSDCTFMIKNQDDRIIALEEYLFEEQRCRMCTTRSAHGITMSTQKIYYQDLGDSFDGVALFDSSGRIVMYKHYNIDPEGAFSKVIRENWSMKSIPKHIQNLDF